MKNSMEVFESIVERIANDPGFVQNAKTRLSTLRSALVETRRLGYDLSFGQLNNIDRRYMNDAGQYWWSAYNYTTEGNTFTDANGDTYLVTKTFCFTCMVTPVV